ncbi:MAG: DinB family protein [Bacteroidetes bacterium]|nr:DinB family protein [Bacteroidota bacterium]
MQASKQTLAYSFLPMVLSIAALLCLGATHLCASPQPDLSPVGKVLDRDLSYLESVLVPLAEAMPADKYDFAPTDGEFKGVRTFAQQISHTAACINTVAAAVLEEELAPELVSGEYGPSTLKTKEDLVAYLKNAFTYAHAAMAKVTAENMMDPVQAWWGKSPRLSMANVAMWHSFDHYGQLVLYLRMNGIVPPASRPKK